MESGTMSRRFLDGSSTHDYLPSTCLRSELLISSTNCTSPPPDVRSDASAWRSLLKKLRSMHMAISGTINHFYRLQHALTKATPKPAYLSNNFHSEIQYEQNLVEGMGTRPI